MTDLRITGTPDCRATLILAHGAGAGMETPFLEFFANRLPELGVRVARFEFAYMRERANSGKRRPPPRAEQLTGEYLDALAALEPAERLLIGGKSMGGRVASLIADDLFRARRIDGLVCLGYPFHPPKAPGKLRTQHLEVLACPALIVQGARDPFGTRQEVAGYGLPSSIRLHWVGGGNHDLAPSAKAREAAWQGAVDAIAAFAVSAGPKSGDGRQN